VQSQSEVPLPRIRNDCDWEKGLRASIRASTAKGWSVREDKGKMRLEVRNDRLRGSVTLPFDWAKSCVGDALIRARNIYTLTTEGYELRDAAQIATNSAPQERFYWEEMIGRFKEKKISSGLRITEKTWKDDYQPYLEHAETTMACGQSPKNAQELAVAVLNGWNDRPRSREKALIALKAFLDFAIENHGLPARSWSLSKAQLREVRGRSSTRKELAILEDTEIIQLANEVATTRNGEKWKYYIMLTSTYGLRREEAWHCIPKQHPRHGLQMWCRYEKISGSYKTLPRWLLPLPPNGSNWIDLVIAAKTGTLELPAAAPSAWNTLLSRLDFWKHLCEKYSDRGQYLKPGAIRDTYSYRAHQQSIAIHRICKAMGHSLITHQNHYVWATEDSVFE
jgi:hypothetical protein